MSLTNCVSRTPQEALENFDKAAQAFGVMKEHEGTIAYAIVNHEYLHAKEELKIWMSYIP